MTQRRGRRSVAAILAVPVLFALTTLGGLVAGLAGSSRWHVVAWCGVGAPLSTAMFFLTRRLPLVRK